MSDLSARAGLRPRSATRNELAYSSKGIETNIYDHGLAKWRKISFITEAKIISDLHSGRMIEVEIEIGEWLMRAIVTISRNYFPAQEASRAPSLRTSPQALRTPERVEINLEVLQEKCGSKSAQKGVQADDWVNLPSRRNAESHA